MAAAVVSMQIVKTPARRAIMEDLLDRHVMPATILGQQAAGECA
jgi:hypothetical protein